ncbi:Gamma-tubulin complex component 6 [Bienertia sinuspersici]
MAVDLHFEESLLRQLKPEDPWLPPKPWESVLSENGASYSPSSNHASLDCCLYDLSSVSEASLVRLVLNALQGVQSAVLSIEKLSALFCADPADRSSHRIPTLWNRSLSTCALGKMLKSIGCSGSLVILLHKFVDYFTMSTSAGGTMEIGQGKPGHEGENMKEGNDTGYPSQSLVNQAFAVAVRTVLEGYLCALDTLSASVNLRRTFNDLKLGSEAPQLGSFTSVSHSKVTLLETYLHTKELRTQIEALGHLCHLSDSALCFSTTSFEDVVAKAFAEIRKFPWGGNLLTYLYTELQVVDPAHCSLLKFLFQRALEPYCRFIRSWIYEAKISDPYDEFVVEYSADPLPYSHGKAGIPADFPLASVREQDGVSIPCFLRDVLVPLLRAGQQLQMVMKLLRLCNYVHAGEDNFEDILPGSSDFCSNGISGSPLSFNREEIEAIVLSRKNYYCKMQEKLDKFMGNLDIKYRQVVSYDAAYDCTSYNGANMDALHISNLDETLDSPSAADERDLNRDSEVSSTEDDFSYVQEPSDCSSTEGSDEQVNAGRPIHLHDNVAGSKPNYLSSLCFSSLSPTKAVGEVSVVKQSSDMRNDLVYPCCGEISMRKHDTSCVEFVELSRPWMSESKYVGEKHVLGWPVGGLRGNPLSIHQRYSNYRNPQNSSSDQYKIMPDINRDLTPGITLMHNVGQGNEFSSSSSYLTQSWNARHSGNALSMNPMLTKNAFILDVDKPREKSTNISKAFPYFDFLSATNPLKVYEKRSSFDQRHHIGPKNFPSLDTETSGVGSVNGCRMTHKVEDVRLAKDDLDHSNASKNLEDVSGVHLKNACGGSSWQVLLRGSPGVNHDSNEHGLDKNAIYEMPLDFIIDKGLVQEIMLQLSIKLLEGGFDLQEHFYALRRYHFMEIADWADLFVTSLWHHKWYFTEADQKIPEIQGLLESSIQRSSCESDHCKDRLYVYVKNQNKTPFSTAALGLGYKIDWPVTIVLTPDALRIYADIFTYLIQLKLAVLSLADVWCSLKDFKHLISETGQKYQSARTKFNCIVKLRHQVNHFVSTLQQYVLSQLSDVSWCRFCFSLKHEVKDMMDLESVHMAYLKDSLRICFLSDETLSISQNIERILQCALDFRSCLVKGLGGSDKQDLVEHMSQINVSQALSIKRKFDKNLKELHSSYLKSSKQGELGLPRLWTCLNYNDYYTDAFVNDMWH